MAGTFSKAKLSGSTNGKQIKITQTATAGDLIHTAVATTAASKWDEVWIWADNDDTSPHLLTIQFGGTTDIDNTIKVTVPARGTEGADGLTPVVAGLILQNGLIIRAFADSANKIKLSGYVNNIT